VGYFVYGEEGGYDRPIPVGRVWLLDKKTRYKRGRTEFDIKEKQGYDAWLLHKKKKAEKVTKHLNGLSAVYR